MRHIFVINPGAGPTNAEAEIRSKLAACGAEAEVYVTADRRDATRFVREVCESSDEEVRFYACGGDGTLNEVVSGAVGFPHAAVGCYPCGSGNDYVKYYGGKDAFLSIPDQLVAPDMPVDVLRVNDRYAVNASHFGFDSVVVEGMVRCRRHKWLSGKRAYTYGVARALFKGMKNNGTLTADGEVLNPDGKLLLCTLACGAYVGGSFRCAPRSRNDDGLTEVCLVRPVSRFTFLRLMGDYTAGNHLDKKAFRKVIIYRRAAVMTVDAPEPISLLLDGEPITGTHFDIQTLPRAVRLIVPAGATVPSAVTVEATAPSAPFAAAVPT